MSETTLLGIETSCDETAAAVAVETAAGPASWEIRSSVIASQVEIHREWGGVVPELASRQHLRDICGVVERALCDGRVGWAQLDAIAVTQGPGLVGSLLVGVAFAKALAVALDRPLVPVHHLAGHIESLFLCHPHLPLPAVVLVVSGGHTSLYHLPQAGTYRLVGRTRDDAAGEAFDKVAKLLGLTYPGGPVIDRLARRGDEHAIRFPVARMTHADRVEEPATVVPPGSPKIGEGRMDFSFSGLKTAVARYVRRRQATGPGALSETELADICASFQRAVVDALLDRAFEAARRFGACSLGIAGGVSANSRLREVATARGVERGLPVMLPTLHLSTDNAAMIAAAGLRRLRAGMTASLDLNADAALTL
ncbi:MAG: tRNA (adenosine(37)-N6)-threonylcarbamoyltransferase complex transferase subunit TsaD [Acidobacteria bacterium]|nr:tRNA (adenosine(37)-N6)-threonylcarbamoyltransferase complex transferase subunit TsaD [Acidobacteriota bacterium]